jgi:predicted metalloprotease with PDZ domain
MGNSCCAEDAGRSGTVYTEALPEDKYEVKEVVPTPKKDEVKDVETYVEKVAEKVEAKVEQAVTAVEEKAADAANAVQPEEFGLKFQFLKSESAKEADGRVTLYAKYPQLGMSFSNNLPVVINKVQDNLWAKSAGVEPGWVIVSCAGKELADFKEFKDAQELILKQVTELRAKEECGVKFQFIKSESAKDETITLYAKKGPLGFKFADSMPVTISDVTKGTWAHTVGVQCGWVIVSIMDKPMSDFKESKNAQEYLEKHVKLLG